MNRRVFLALIGSLGGVGAEACERILTNSPEGPGQERSVLEVLASFAALGRRLRIQYRVVNRGHDSVYVLNEMTAGYKAFVDFEGPVIAVSLRLWPLPPGMLTDEPNVPLARRLLRGESADGAIELPLPISEVNPYTETQSSAPLARVLSTIRLDVGYVAANEVEQPEEIRSGDATLYRFDYYALMGRQSVVSSEAVGLTTLRERVVG